MKPNSPINRKQLISSSMLEYLLIVIRCSGYFDQGFDGILDECDPVIKALAIDASLNDVLSLESSEEKARAATNASQIDVSRAVPFSNEPTFGRTSPASANASPPSPPHAALPEETVSAPGSPLFTPTSEAVDLPRVQELVQPKTLLDLPDGGEECSTVDAAQVSTSPAPIASLSPLGSLPVRAADIDVLSLLGPPSFQSSEIAPDLPSPGTSDATASLPSSSELSPIPGSKLANIIRKRKRSLIVHDDYQPAPVSDADSVVEVDAPYTVGNKYATSVPPSLLDKIAAAAVAATIRASPGVNVFAAPYNANRARKTSKASKKAPPNRRSSMNSASTGYMPNTFPDQAQWQVAGMPPQTSMFPPPLASVDTPQVYINEGSQNNATYAPSSGLAPPALYGPSDTNAKRMRVVGPSFSSQPMALQGAGTSQTMFPTAGHFQSASPPLQQAFINTESNSFGHYGIVAPEIQQYANSALGLDFIQSPTLNFELPQIPDDWSGAGQNWTDPSQLWDTSALSLPL